MNNERQKCTRCKMNLTLDKFKMKRDDTYQKQCLECNTNRRIAYGGREKGIITNHPNRKQLVMTVNGQRIFKRYAECGLEEAMKIMENTKAEMLQDVEI